MLGTALDRIDVAKRPISRNSSPAGASHGSGLYLTQGYPAVPQITKRWNQLTMDSSYCGDSLMGVSIAIVPIQIAVVGARFYTRRIQSIKCTIDDYLIIPALPWAVGTIHILEIAGLGYHFEYVQQTSPERLVSLQKGLFASQILSYPFIVTPAKFSILFFYNRIFNTFGITFRMLSHAVGFVVLGTGIGVLFAAIFQCSPVEYAWDKTIKGSCINQQALKL
ncbi:uncharacterized protein BDV17DRAFT_38261 [Aspergillus undulatus]|uniref:uncharacterized protein n=1 Tax=Aspergillus undulatus TaxID=1810928 RepID=UPI003CCD637D